MENSGLVLIDTNIIIEYYKNNQFIIDKLKSIQEENLSISDVTSAELIYGARNKAELKKIEETISTIATISINQEISKLSIKLISEYSLSHKLALPDALIAATAMTYEMPLYTLNKKDFQYLEIKLFE